MNYITAKFSKVTISIEAKEGEITEQEMKDKIEETFNQLGIWWRRSG